MKRSLRRTGIVLLLFLVAIVGKTYAQITAPDMKLDFLLVEAEHSKDSHSTTTKISISGRELEYLWHYNGHHPDKNFKRDIKASATLTDAHVAALLNYLHENHLDVDQKEHFPSAENRISINAKLTTIQSGKTVTIEFIDAGLGGKDKVIPLQNLVTFIKDTILVME